MGSSESYPMVGGNGVYTYARNSHTQKGSIVGTKLKLLTAIDGNLDVRNASISTSVPFRIVDLGCSVGPNTFVAVKDIIEAIQHKCQAKGQVPPEFQVFFSDHVTNDFNALFTNLPADRGYFVAAVPGSFHGRLFPEKSLDFVYSSNSLHWLSSVPKELNDLNTPAFNKGRIYYTNAPEEVGEAYSVQFAKDFESFMFARSLEMVPGGLMVLIFSGRPNGTIPTKASFGPLFLPLESCLAEMANEGLLSKSKIDTFNLPIYHPSFDELTLIIERNGCFDIKQMEASLPEFVRYMSMQSARSGFEELLASHFGKEIMDELFTRYANKIDGLPPLSKADGLGRLLFVVLKRKPGCRLHTSKLFPEASLDFVYSSNSLHRISIPKELHDLNSPAFNKGRIHYTNAPKDISDACSLEFAREFESFILARSLEMVPGGLMVLLLSGRPNGTIPTESSTGPLLLPLESWLIEMANEGLLSKSKIDSFNFPIYNPSPDELTSAIRKNGRFDIKQMETSFPESSPYVSMQLMRSTSEELLSSHFRKEIID